MSRVAGGPDRRPLTAAPAVVRAAGSLTVVIATAAVAAGCRPTAVPSAAADEPQPALPSPELPGTYDLAVCRGGRCALRDTATAYLLATVVLFDSAGAAAADLPPAHYERGQRATGCFWIRYHKKVGDSYAGISPRAYFMWGGVGSIRFPLYRSPDAGYVVELRRTATGFDGGGTSWGVGVVEIQAPRDTVVAARVGPPDRLRSHTTG